jgi:hypothetical protein
MMIHVYNPSTQGAKAGGSRVQGQAGQHIDTLSQKKKILTVAVAGLSSQATDIYSHGFIHGHRPTITVRCILSLEISKCEKVCTLESIKHDITML